MSIGKIAILGAGAGGQTSAADLAFRGFEVHLWGRDPEKLAGVFASKQIRVVGYKEGVAKLAGASNDLGETLKSAKLVIVTVPGFAQREVAERCAPYIEDGQIVFVTGNSGMGSLVFARVFKEKKVSKEFFCSEYSNIPNGGRFLEPGVVNRCRDFAGARNQWGYHVSAFPAKQTNEVMKVISQAYPGMPSSENCLASALNIRAVGHHGVTMLLGAAAIEHLCYWDITDEGFTPSAMKVVKAIDDERKAIQKAWGFEHTDVYGASVLSGEKGDWDKIEAGSTNRTMRDYRVKWAWKDRLYMKHRFVTESIPYGYVLRSSAAAKIGIKVPITDSIIRLLSVINGEDYFSLGRTLDSLGLGDMNAQEITRFLQEGIE